MPRAALVFLHDVLMAIAAWPLAYVLRFNFEIPSAHERTMVATMLPVVLIQMGCFLYFRLYRGMWRFASIPDLHRLLLAVGTATIATPGLLFILAELTLVPRSVLILDPILLLLAMGGSRFLYRAWKSGHLFGDKRSKGQPALILGAGEASAALLKELTQNEQWWAVGLLDDDPEKIGRRIGNVPILGHIADVAQHAARTNAVAAIIAMPTATAARRRHAAEAASAANLQVLTVPAYADLLSGKISISSVRRIELEDLLGRDKVELDSKGLHQLLSGKVVMITGAGGSIGSELCRQVARFSPKFMVFFELSEYALYAVEQEFVQDNCRVVCVVGDTKDKARLAEVFEQFRPDIVFHAAAYKHVPMMENGNAWQAVRNNALGTLRVARAAAASGAAKVVLISTDKAVNPTNVMGASKRLAELICQSIQSQQGRTRFVMVRFGNVLGSSGSVIPKFRSQISNGGPLTVTHPDIIRYFMLIPEAAQLVLQAGLMGRGGEIFVLDMGEPIKIANLARDMIRLSGFTEDDIEIEFTGLRPGEKLYEELLADGETTQPTSHQKLRIAKPTEVPDGDWLAQLEAWLMHPVRNEMDVKNDLMRLIPEYRPASR